MIDYLRLGFATAVVLLPGWLVARAFGQRSVSATVTWGLAVIFAAWALVFTVYGSISLALGVLVVIGVAALIPAFRRPPVLGRLRGRTSVFAGGVVLGALLWHVAGIVSGDGLFHLARVRKLVDLGHLHLRTVDEFKDGGLHPGYAFPLWHCFEALVAKVSGLDPGIVVQHESSLLAPLACVVVWEAGVAVFESATAGFAVLAAQLGLYCFAAGHGGSWTSLGLPATAARQLLVPAAIALFFGYVESRKWALALALAAVFGELTLVHSTYAVFVLIPLAGYCVVRLDEWRRSAVALAAACLPTLAGLLWLRPLADETLAHNPSPAALAAELHKYANQLTIWSDHRFRLAPALFSRTGAVAVAALALVPLAGFAFRRRWSALVLGGTVGLLALLLVPTLFVHFSKLVSLSQSRRAAGFVPYSFAFAGGLALLARSWLLAPVALVAGIALERKWPGDFSYGLSGSGPGVVTWIALIGGAAAVVLGFVFFRRRSVRERHGVAAVAAALFVLPVAVHGFRHWTPLVTSDSGALTPTLLRELRRVPPRTVIIASPQISYRLLAAAPVYVVCAPTVHVANTIANDPKGRKKACAAWLAGRAPGVPARYGATWAVRRGHLYALSR